MKNVFDSGWTSEFKRFVTQSAMKVTVGLHENTTRDDGNENAEIGFYNEFREPVAFAFLRPTFDENKRTYQKDIKRLFAEASTGRIAPRDIGHLVGEEVRDDVVDTIDNNNYKVKKSTQDKKDRLGQGSQALIATEQMRDAVDYEVTK